MSSIHPLLSEILRVPSEQGQALALWLLQQHYSSVECAKTYCYAQGTIPICLVAHTDTVWDEPPTTLYHDAEKRVVWSDNGLGADDRAGVYAIAHLLAEGFRPSVLFTDGEEVGGIGAKDAAFDLAAPPIHLLVQMDRANRKDAVYYDCANPSLERWITRRGFATAHGTYTDICELMPAWGIAGVNLSIGYYGQHTLSERLNLAEMERTIGRVRRMLKRPPRQPFAYAQRERKILSRLPVDFFAHELSLDVDREHCADCNCALWRNEREVCFGCESKRADNAVNHDSL